MFFEGIKHGFGKFIWPDKCSYEGCWQNNKFNGKGTYKWPDGRKYTGDWLDNNMHGYGVYLWKDGRRYEGDYKHNRKHGYGTYTLLDGREYEGNWVDGKQHGEGIRRKNGSEKRGLWENGELKCWLDESETNGLDVSRQYSAMNISISQNMTPYGDSTRDESGHL